MKKVIILGNSGNTPDIIDAINAIDSLECVGILDDNVDLHGQSYCGVEVLGSLTSAVDYPDCHCINGIHGIGSHKERDAILARTGVPLERFVTVVHPHAVLSSSAVVGPGTTILANVTVCANATIGSHCIILPNSVVNHDVVIGDYTAIASSVSLSGGVSVGALSYIGAGALVRERLRIGEKALVAMGAVVVKDVDCEETVMGCPARPVAKKSDGRELS